MREELKKLDKSYRRLTDAFQAYVITMGDIYKDKSPKEFSIYITSLMNGWNKIRDWHFEEMDKQ